mmetsp:Transcript_95478/g.307805  ORF Transcript_95478/g.307805 Transcript_95478/m.307805 type:complete len:271 (+) Transcript_95478:92-904(+)
MLRRLRGWVGWGGGEVSMPKLVAALKSSTGVSVDGPEQLLDFSLLTDEVDQIAAEKSALGDSFVHWPTFGVVPAAFQKACREYDVAECPSTMQPGNMTAENVHTLAKAFPKWDVDHLAERVEILHSRLHEDLDGLDLARVIFFHCSCGCDRTGELAAAYSMRYLNQTFTEMYVENAKVAGRNTVYANQVAAQWYCEHLRTQGLYTGDDCGNCGPFRCVDTGSPVVSMWQGRVVSIGLFVFVACLAMFLPRCCRQGATEDKPTSYQKLQDK